MVIATDWAGQYERAKQKLITDKGICAENRALFKQYFKDQEYKLKRVNQLTDLDHGAYKTLLAYIVRFRNVNLWFKNKPLAKLTRADIKRVYDGLEDGKIKTQKGQRFKSRHDYYSKVFKSRLFEMIGKADLAKSVIQYCAPNEKEVRFITEDDFRKLLSKAQKPLHQLLLWLAFDIGENINSLLRLKKSDFVTQPNPHTKEREYRVNLRREILKRSRKPRSELTNYPETVSLLDEILEPLAADDYLFPFDYANAKKIIDRCQKRSGVVCQPKGEKVTWKDLRSGMACDLLKKRWTTDEVNARLGHKPSSDEIDKYVNFLAIDRHDPKKKVSQFKTEELQTELEALRQRERLHNQRQEAMQQQLDEMRALMEKLSRVQAKEFAASSR